MLLGNQHSLSGELGENGKKQSLIAKLQKGQSVSEELENAAETSAVQEISKDGFAMVLSDGSVKAAPQMIFDRLSFTHIVRILHVEEPLQRAFYAVEAMRGPWSVRELQRQIDSNYYERSGWSKKPELLARKVSGAAGLCGCVADAVVYGLLQGTLYAAGR